MNLCLRAPCGFEGEASLFHVEHGVLQLSGRSLHDADQGTFVFSCRQSLILVASNSIDARSGNLEPTILRPTSGDILGFVRQALAWTDSFRMSRPR